MDAADLNALVDSGTALTGIIFDQPLKTTPAPADGLLIYDSAVVGGDLKKTAISQLPVVTSVGLSMPAPFSVGGSPVTAAGTLAVTMPNQTLGKFYASPVNSTGAPSFRPITPRDIAFFNINVAADLIDWNTGSVFVKGINVNWSPSMTGGLDGQSVYVVVYQIAPGNFTVNWNLMQPIRWSGGTMPVMSPLTNHSDIYQFWLTNGILYGQRVLTDAF